jgi:hypothetical protein
MFCCMAFLWTGYLSAGAAEVQAFAFDDGSVCGSRLMLTQIRHYQIGHVDSGIRRFGHETLGACSTACVALKALWLFAWLLWQRE